MSPTRILAILMTLFVGAWAAGLAPASANELVSAKIGIQRVMDSDTVRAKTRDRIKANDKLRIFVIPEEDAYVYVISSDKSVSTLLHRGQVKKGEVLVLPGTNQYYQPDGSSSQERFTIICSPGELTDIRPLLDQKSAPVDEWDPVEKKLESKSKIPLSEMSSKPIGIGGNVRGFGGSDNKGFASQLQTFSGKSLLVKRYDFAVKK